MNDRQAMVLERKGKKITAMTRSGKFITLRSAHEGIMPGDTITVPSPFMASLVLGRLVPALALSAIMVFVSLFGNQGYLMARPAVAYMTLDSYGSIELVINDRNQVASAQALDEAGFEILSSVNYRLRPVEGVVADLVKAQGAKGATNVVISLVQATPEHEISQLEDKVANEVAREVWKSPDGDAGDSDPAGGDDPPQSPKVSVAMVTLDLDARTESKNMGISAGRAASWALSEWQSDDFDHETPEAGSKSQDPPLKVEDPLEIWETIRTELPRINLDSVVDHEEPEKYLKDVTKQWLKELDHFLKAEEKARDKDKGKDKDKDKDKDRDRDKNQDNKKDKDKSKSGANSRNDRKTPGTGDPRNRSSDQQENPWDGFRC